MFDLPMKTKVQRRRYARFRKLLLGDGFSRLQFSVYARYCASEEVAAAHRGTVRDGLPAEGHVRIFRITDRQFGLMENYIGKSSEESPKAPAQLMLF